MSASGGVAPVIRPTLPKKKGFAFSSHRKNRRGPE